MQRRAALRGPGGEVGGRARLAAALQAVARARVARERGRGLGLPAAVARLGLRHGRLAGCAAAHAQHVHPLSLTSKVLACFENTYYKFQVLLRLAARKALQVSFS